MNEYKGNDCDDPSPGLSTPRKVWDDVIAQFELSKQWALPENFHVSFDVGTKVKVTVHLEKR